MAVSPPQIHRERGGGKYLCSYSRQTVLSLEKWHFLRYRLVRRLAGFGGRNIIYKWNDLHSPDILPRNFFIASLSLSLMKGKTLASILFSLSSRLFLSLPVSGSPPQGSMAREDWGENLWGEKTLYLSRRRHMSSTRTREFGSLPLSWHMCATRRNGWMDPIMCIRNGMEATP